MATDVGALPQVGVASIKWPLQTSNPAPFLIDNASTRPAVALNGGANDGDDFSGPSPRHLETTVILFADGHVKSQRVESFYRADVANPCLNVDTGCL